MPRTHCVNGEFIPIVESVAIDMGLGAAIAFAIVCRQQQNKGGASGRLVALEAQKVGISRSTVNRHLKKLCDAEYLTRQPGILPVNMRPSKDNGICGYCGEWFPSLDGHHIVLRSNKGKDVPENITYLCPNHHRLAHTLVYHTDLQIYQDGCKWRIG